MNELKLPYMGHHRDTKYH